MSPPRPPSLYRWSARRTQAWTRRTYDIHVWTWRTYAYGRVTRKHGADEWTRRQRVQRVWERVEGARVATPS
eukprot:564168-Prymnesium_polylepis.1